MQLLQIPLKALKTPTLSEPTALLNLVPPLKSMLDLQEHPEATVCKQLCNRAKGRQGSAQPDLALQANTFSSRWTTLEMEIS